jgi:predicted DCC family thiol-disulfide oxidoreductase YuxK
MPAAERLDSWHLLTESGVVSGGAAAEPLARALPGGQPLAALFRRFPGATDRAYRWIAANRARFGRIARLEPGEKLRRVR